MYYVALAVNWNNRKEEKSLSLSLEKLKNGDVNEIRLFARTVSMWVYNAVISLVQNKEDAEEIVQDTIIAGLDGLGKFRNESKLKSWIYSIALNKSKDLLRFRNRKKRAVHIVSIDDNNDRMKSFEPVDFIHPGILLEDKEAIQFLFTCINQLPANQKQALILSKIDKLNYLEIAEIMQTTTKAVESNVGRARKNLEKLLNKKYKE